MVPGLRFAVQMVLQHLRGDKPTKETFETFEQALKATFTDEFCKQTLAGACHPRHPSATLRDAQCTHHAGLWLTVLRSYGYWTAPRRPSCWPALHRRHYGAFVGRGVFVTTAAGLRHQPSAVERVAYGQRRERTCASARRL